MVGRVLRALQGEIGGLHEAAYFLGVFALLSQVLALLRDRTFAHILGAGSELDIYFAAFRVPDILFVLVASLVSAYILIPFLTEKVRESKAAAQAFLHETITFFVFAIGALSLLAYCFMPFLVSFVAPGFQGTSYEADIVFLSRLLLLQPILLGLSGILGSVTQLRRRFVLYSLSPVLYNVGIMAGAYFLYESWGLMGLGVGVILGALLHLAVQLPPYVGDGYTFTFKVPGKETWGMIMTAVPRALALMSGQVAFVALLALASLFTAGSIAVFNFAYNLQSVPLSVIAVSYSVAAFPTLAGFFARKEMDAFLLHMSTALRHIIFWAVPAMVFFIVLRAHIVRVVLGSGAFSWEDTRLTAAALALFVCALLAQAFSMLFIRAYYAAGKTLTPLWISLTGSSVVVLSGVAFALLFHGVTPLQTFLSILFRVEGIPGSEILILPFSFALGSWVSALLFMWTFKKDFGTLSPALTRVFLEVVGASVIAGYATYLFLVLVAPWVDMNTFLGISTHGFFAGLMGVVVLCVLLWLLGSREFREVAVAISRRLAPTSVPLGQDVDNPSV